MVRVSVSKPPLGDVRNGARQGTSRRASTRGTVAAAAAGTSSSSANTNGSASSAGAASSTKQPAQLQQQPQQQGRRPRRQKQVQKQVSPARPAPMSRTKRRRGDVNSSSSSSTDPADSSKATKSKQLASHGQVVKRQRVTAPLTANSRTTIASTMPASSNSHINGNSVSASSAAAATSASVEGSVAGGGGAGGGAGATEAETKRRQSGLALANLERCTVEGCTRPGKKACVSAMCHICCGKVEVPCPAHDAAKHEREAFRAELQQFLNPVKRRVLPVPRGACAEKSLKIVGDTAVLFCLQDFLQRPAMSRDVLDMEQRRERIKQDRRLVAALTASSKASSSEQKGAAAIITASAAASPTIGGQSPAPLTRRQSRSAPASASVSTASSPAPTSSAAAQHCGAPKMSRAEALNAVARARRQRGTAPARALQQWRNTWTELRQQPLQHVQEPLRSQMRAFYARGCVGDFEWNP